MVVEKRKKRTNGTRRYTFVCDRIVSAQSTCMIKHFYPFDNRSTQKNTKRILNPPARYYLDSQDRLPSDNPEHHHNLASFLLKLEETHQGAV